MTCYQRHLGGLFEQLDLPYDRANRQRVHEAILRLLRLPEDAHCPEVWAALKTEYPAVQERLPELAEDLAGVLDHTN
ncbi:MAG: hypothetical protein WCF04_04995 [Candidatus Nanopelagicales bacterium]